MDAAYMLCCHLLYALIINDEILSVTTENEGFLTKSEKTGGLQPVYAAGLRQSITQKCTAYFFFLPYRTACGTAEQTRQDGAGSQSAVSGPGRIGDGHIRVIGAGFNGSRGRRAQRAEKERRTQRC